MSANFTRTIREHCYIRNIKNCKIWTNQLAALYMKYSNTLRELLVELTSHAFMRMKANWLYRSHMLRKNEKALVNIRVVSLKGYRRDFRA